MNSHEGAASTTATAPGCVTAVMGAQGGCGTTTVACSLASVLATGQNQVDQGPVLLLELDGHDADLHLCDEPPLHTLDDVLQVLGRLDHALLQAMLPAVRANLHLLAGGLGHPHTPMETGPAIQGLLMMLRTCFTHIVVDLGHSDRAVALWPWVQPDRCLLVCKPDLPGLRQVGDLLCEWPSLVDPCPRPVLLVNQVPDKTHAAEIEELHRIAAQAMAGTPSSVTPLCLLPWVPEAARGALLAAATLQSHQPRGPWAIALGRGLAQWLPDFGPPQPSTGTIGAGLQRLKIWKDQWWTRLQTA